MVHAQSEHGEVKEGQALSSQFTIRTLINIESYQLFDDDL